MVEERLNKSSLLYEEVDDIVWAFDQPKGEDLVKIPAKSWIQKVSLRFLARIRHLKIREESV